MVGRLAEIERHDHQARRGEGPGVNRPGRVVAARPRAAVDVDQRGERTSRRSLRAIDAGEALSGRGPGEGRVDLVHLVGSRGIEANRHGHGRVLLGVSDTLTPALSLGEGEGGRTISAQRVRRFGSTSAGEPLELGHLVVADEADAEIGHPGVGVALERRGHGVGRAEPHEAAHVHAAAVVGREELRGDAMSGGDVVLHPHRGVDAQGKAGKRAAVAGERLVGPLAQHPAVGVVEIRRDDPVAEPGEAVELGGNHLGPVARGDEDGRSLLAPRQRPDGVVDQVDAVALVVDGIAAPEHPPHLHVLLQPAHPPLVVHAARRPLALRRRQAPAHAEAEHDPSRARSGRRWRSGGRGRRDGAAQAAARRCRAGRGR